MVTDATSQTRRPWRGFVASYIHVRS